MASRTTTTNSAAFDRGIEPIVRFFSRDQAKALVAYSGDDQLRGRIDELARKSNECELSNAELEEYKGYVRANNFIAVLQSKAHKWLSEE